MRVIEYALPGLPDSQPRYRLLTTLLDHNQAPALDLAALYHERWQVEAVFDELKTPLLKLTFDHAGHAELFSLLLPHACSGTRVHRRDS